MIERLQQVLTRIEQLPPEVQEDGVVKVWEVSSGRQHTRLFHNSMVNAISFSPDGRFLATASWDHTAGVWEISSNRQIARLTHESGVTGIIFSPNGKYVATASGDGTAGVWLWKPEDLIAEAQTRLTRNLTKEEWKQYIGDELYRKTCPHLP